MNIQEAKQYLKNHKERRLTGGISGAKVYDIAGKYVLKCVSRADLENDEQYDAYQREAIWYKCANSGKKGFRLSYLPEILDLYCTEEETAVLMKHYLPIPQKFDTELLKKIMGALAAVHTTDIPEFLGQIQRGRANLLSEDQISASLSGWRSVLDEHSGIFLETPLEQLAKKINYIISWHEQEESVLNHGDFHRDNLLLDGNGNILICDWQGISVGAASGDLSFFFSRLSADSIYLDEKQAVRFYVQEVRRLSGKILLPEEICRHMDAADIITSFVFWHEYLHGNDVDRVRGIYGKMVDKFQRFVDK